MFMPFENEFARARRLTPPISALASFEAVARLSRFTAAANEAGISRRFGGIHFIDGDLEGRRVGKKIGKAAFHKSMSLFDGRAHEDDEDGDD